MKASLRYSHCLLLQRVLSSSQSVLLPVLAFLFLSTHSETGIEMSVAGEKLSVCCTFSP